MAGLFQSFLDQQSKMKDIDLASKLENTAGTLEKLVDYLKSLNQGNTEAVSSLLKSMHPLVHKLSESFKIDFGFWIDDINMLNNFLSFLGWTTIESQEDSSTGNFYIWSQGFPLTSTLYITKTLFDNNGKLKDVKLSEWKEDYLQIKSDSSEQLKQINAQNEEIDDLPF